MVLFLQQAIIFALKLIPVAISSLALLGFIGEFILSLVEPNFGAQKYDYIIGENLDGLSQGVLTGAFLP